MTQLYFTVKEVATQFIDPVSKQIIWSIMQRLGLWDYFALGIYIDNQRTSVSQDGDGQGNIRMGNNRCDVHIDTHYDPNNQTWVHSSDYNTPAYGTSVRWRKNYQSIFEDREVGVSLQEFTVPFGLDFTFALTFKSYDSAQMALDRIQTLSDGNVANQVHDIVYSYPIELDLMGIFSRIFKARKSLNTTMNFYQYMNTMARSQMSYYVNKYDIGKANPNWQYRVKKQQMGCIALMQCEQDAPEPQMQDAVSDAWVINFTYKLQAGRPRALQLTLPPVIEQTPLPNQIFKKPPVQFDAHLQGGMQTACFDTVLRSFSDYKNGDLVLGRLPNYDDFIIPHNSILKKYKYNPLVIGIVLIDPTKPTTVDLNNLDTIQLSDQVKEILATHSADDLFGIEGIFNVTIYSNDIPVDRSLLDFDPTTLNVTFNVTRTTHVYRIVLSEAMTVKTLNPKWMDTILQYRYFFPMTIFRSLDYLVKMGAYRATSTDALINLINRLMKCDKLNDIIRWMIQQGYTTPFIFQFTQTSTQFADYISNTKAQVIRNEPTADRVEYTLFDVFINRLVALGFVNKNNLPKKYMKSPQGYPYGPNSGGFVDFNIPMRVWNVQVGTKG